MGKMMELPVDVLMSIFLRFSAKPLLQFKCVCKLWYQVIGSNHFAMMHLGQTLRQTHMEDAKLQFVFRAPGLSLAEFDTFDHVVELDDPLRREKPAFCKIVGYCHGLIALVYFDYDLTAFLYNPTTRTCKKLPVLAPPRWFFKFQCFGFGYDSVSEDYKFVRILVTKTLNTPLWSECMVYSLKGDKWIRVHSVPDTFSPMLEDGNFVCGNLHWVERVTVEYKWEERIVRFSLSDHKFDHVPRPNYEHEILVVLRVGALDGCLCLLVNVSDETEVWVMKEYGVVGSWSRLFKFRQDGSFYFEWPIAFSRDRSELFLQRSEGGVVAFRIETGKVRDVEVTDNNERCFETFVTMENLVMLEDGSNGEQKQRKKRKVEEKTLTGGRYSYMGY